MDNSNIKKYEYLLNVLPLKIHKEMFLGSKRNVFLKILNNKDLSEIFFKKIQKSFELSLDLNKNIYKYVNKSVKLNFNKEKLEDFILFYLNKILIFICKINEELKNNNTSYIFSIINDFNPELVLKASIYNYFNIEFLDVKKICIVNYSFFRLLNNFNDKKVFEKNIKALSNKVLLDKDISLLNSDFKFFSEKYLKTLNKNEIYILWYILSVLKIYKKSYYNNKIFTAFLFKRFINIFLNEDINKKSKLYLLRNSHEIISFFALKINKNNKKEKLFISFNTKQTLSGFGLGIYLFNKIIKNEIKNGFTINAETYLSSSSDYLEKYGFVMNKILKNEFANIEYVSLLSVNKKFLQKIFFKQEKYSQNDIIKLKNNFKNSKLDYFIKEIKKPNSSSIFKVLDLFINKNKYIATRYFYNNSKLYIAFEKIGD